MQCKHYNLEQILDIQYTRYGICDKYFENNVNSKAVRDNIVKKINMVMFGPNFVTSIYEVIDRDL